MKYGHFKQMKIMQWEKKFITKILLANGWNLKASAAAIELDRSNLQRLVRRHGLKRPAKTLVDDSFKKINL